MSWPTVTYIYDYLDEQGDPIEGFVEFELNVVRLIDPADPGAVIPVRRRATISTTGHLSIDLTVTDGAGMPTGLYWTARERLKPGGGQVLNFLAPTANAGGTIQLGQYVVAPTLEPNDQYTFLVQLAGLVSGGGSFYPHHQTVPSASWEVHHGLGRPKAPTVLLDSNPTHPVFTSVEHLDANTTLLEFPSPVTGWAYFG